MKNKYNVYFIQAGDCFSPIKVGYSKNLDYRISQLQTATPNKVRLIATVRCESESNMRFIEETIHHFFRRNRIRGEWFNSYILLRMNEVRNLKWKCEDAHAMNAIPDRYNKRKLKALKNKIKEINLIISGKINDRHKRRG